jgi:hypothetical protein
MFEVGMERSVLARQAQCTLLLQGKDPRRALGNRRGQRPSNPGPPEQGPPTGHASVKHVV